MSNIGHNHAPLEERIFDDPSVSVDDVLAAVAARLERENKPAIDTLSSAAANLAANQARLPETFSQADVAKGLNLLAHMDTHGEEVTVTREAVLTSAEKFVDNLKTLCKPLDEGLAGLEKVLRPRLQSCLEAEIDAHNKDRSDDEPKMDSLTLRSSSGAKVTVTDGDEMVVENKDLIPREFLVPDAKAIAAALKSGKIVPGIGKKRKTSLRISCN